MTWPWQNKGYRGNRPSGFTDVVLGQSVNGKPAASKAATGGSSPSWPV